MSEEPKMGEQEIPEITEDEKELFLFIFIYQYNSNAVLGRSTIHKVHFWIFRLVPMKIFILFYEVLKNVRSKQTLGWTVRVMRWFNHLQLSKCKTTSQTWPCQLFHPPSGNIFHILKIICKI